ncbi:MAG: beta-propeller domain-containing protein [Proteobacteria bacterium]|nr:beta-propeller domain-containing protein [Pseudomonadota bacterium]
MRNSCILALSILGALAFSGCGDSDGSPWCPTLNCVVMPSGSAGHVDVDLSTRKLALTKADTCDDYRKHLLDELAVRIADERFGRHYTCGYDYRNHYWDMNWGFASDDAPTSSSMEKGDAESPEYADSPSEPSSGGSNAGEYTTTNVQEKGVDELDTVKNDGNYMYAIRGNRIHITKIWPIDQMEEVAVIELADLKPEGVTNEYGKLGNSGGESIGDDFPEEPIADIAPDDDYYYRPMRPRGIFLTDDKKLIDISEISGYHYGYRGVISVRVFDVSDPADPKLLKSHQIEGVLADARLIDNRLHLVTTANPQFSWYDVEELSSENIPGVPTFYNPCDEYDVFYHEEWTDTQWERWNKLQEQWHNQKQANKEKYLPVIRAWLDTRFSTLEDVGWPQYSDGNTVKPVVNCENVYIPPMASKDLGFLFVIELSGENYENFTSSALADSGWLVYASQKNLYVSSFSDNWWWNCDNTAEGCRSYTHIHHFNFGDKAGEVKYVNSGEVEGFANNTFYYSEYANHLRVFSSVEDWGNSSAGQKLSILDINTPIAMKETGSYRGFGKDEMIYSARYVGDRGYIVTFRNTDPLFVFDLSDPTAPKLAGELKINGYSSYIHPVGKDHLLTIGEDADDSGWTNGMKLDLYDVSNPAKPTRKYSVKISDEAKNTYAWSEALNNHHAFQYHEGSGLLAIPVNIEKWNYASSDNDWYYNQFSGMFIYRVKPDSDFEFVGGVDHSDLVPEYGGNWWTTVDRSRFYFKNAGVYDKDAYIYTISHSGLKASNANKPDETFGMIQYDPQEDDYWSDYWY